MGLADLISHSLGENSVFNWPWFIELVVCGVLVLFFLFYFNRLFATFVSYALRAFIWHAYRVWIDVQALQLSLLGGRLFFKGVRYHGENETILIHSGFITWRYWLRSVRQADLTRQEDVQDISGDEKVDDNPSVIGDANVQEKDEELGPMRKAHNGEARISVYVHGLEWFIYNRTPMYDAIIRDTDETDKDSQPLGNVPASVVKTERRKTGIAAMLRRRQGSNDASSSDSANLKRYPSEKGDLNDRESLRSAGAASTITEAQDQTSAETSMFHKLLVRVLPVQVECSKVAISMGNEYTKALLVTTVTKAKGHIDAGGCGPYDVFRQLFDFRVEKPVVQMRPNPDFRASQMTSAERIIVNVANSPPKPKWWKLQLDLRRRKRNAVHGLRNLLPWLRSSVESLHHDHHNDKDRSSYRSFTGADPDEGPWHGLNRYLDDDENDEHQAWVNVDYGRFSTILDCPEVHLVFYWDIVGRVLEEHLATPDSRTRKNISGVAPPAYGLDLTVKGGQINYGPWADRLRAELQAIFLPASYKSSVPASGLIVGSWRQSVNMIIRIDIEDEVSLRVPTKESSKDWRWRGRATAVRDAAALRKQREKKHFRLRRGTKGTLGPDIRPFGWLLFSVARDSSVRYDMDMVAYEDGFRNRLFLDLKDTKVTSSVNHDDLWRCPNLKVQCDLSNPLGWNAPHRWRFDVLSESMELFLLRDHMFLLTDLIGDFTAGLKSDYMTFVPFRYSLGISFNNLKLYLSANDYNIIDNPCDLESNTFLILGALTLKGEVEIPLEHFSPSRSSVSFQAEAQTGYLDLKTPVWNTLHAFADYENTATLKQLLLDGSYTFCADTSPQLSDSLVMNIYGKTLRLFLQGFLIRYFMNVKENYFGEDLHFRTFEEYQTALGNDNRLRPVEENRSQANKDNDLDVILTVRAEDSCALMPANIYDRHENIRIDLISGEADMRFTNYYMDLQVNTSPIEVSLESKGEDTSYKYGKTSNCQLYIDSVTVYGHRLFGAPPAEPTYICNWDFDIGNISGECSTHFVRIMIAAVQSFVFTMVDDDNALPATRFEEIHDVIFLRARAGTVRIWLIVSDAALLLDIGSFQLTSNDWAKDNFSQHMKSVIPSITVAAIELASTRRKTSNIVPTLACLRTSLQLALIDRKVDFRRNRDLQQRHLRFHDMRTHRTDCFLRKRMSIDPTSQEMMWSRESPSLPLPEMPIPLFSADSKPKSVGAKSIQRSGTLQRSSSFITSGSGSSTRRRGLRRRGSRSTVDTQSSSASSVSQSISHPRIDKQLVRSYSSSDAHNDGQVASLDHFKSPWVPPHFSLENIVPDTSTLPATEIDTSNTAHVTDQDQDLDFEDDLPTTEESLSHAAVFFKLTDGIAASCSPAFVAVVSQLLQQLVPFDPISVFDGVQRETNDHIRALTTVRSLQIDDFAIQIPRAAIRLVNSHKADLRATIIDQYDLMINDAKFMLRVSPSTRSRADGRPMPNAMIMHASVRSIHVDVIETGYQKLLGAAGLRASLGGTRLWLSLQDEIRMGLQLKTFGLNSQGRSIERFSSLIDRTSTMIKQIMRNFEPQHHEAVVRHLLYHLVHNGAGIKDPVFLSRPSYVLRSADEHVRLNGSWKMAAVLRWRLSVLTSKAKTTLLRHDHCGFIDNPKAVQEDIVAFFNEMKTVWGDPAADGPILATVFGEAGVDVSHPHETIDMEASILLGEGAIILDPGPNQSKLLVQGCDTAFAQKPILSQHGHSSHVHTEQRASRTVQSWIGRVILDLKWELVEFVESLAGHASTANSRYVQEAVISTASESSAALTDDLMVVVGTDALIMNLATINLKLDAKVTDLKASFLSQELRNASAMSLLLASASADARIMDKSKSLLHWRLRLPNIYASRQQETGPSRQAQTIRLAANCETLRFNMEENIVYLVDVVSAIVRDEVKVVQDIVKMMAHEIETEQQKTQPTSFDDLDIRIALCLRNYKLRFALLPTLDYIIAGDAGQTAIVPRGDSKFSIHVDAGCTQHMLVKPRASTRNPTCVVDAPPLNGKVSLDISPSQIKIRASSTVEKVIVEAAMVQTLFDAVYRPENTRFFKSATVAIDNLQAVIEETLQNDRPKLAKPAVQDTVERVILYSVHAVFEGLVINCDTSERSDSDQHASLSLIIRQSVLHIKNICNGEDRPFEQPQFEVNIPTIMFVLDHQLRKQRRNVGKFVMGLRLTGTTEVDEHGTEIQNYRAITNSVKLDLFTETAAVVVETVEHLQSRIKLLMSDEDGWQRKSIRRLTISRQGGKGPVEVASDTASDDGSVSSSLMDSTFSLDLNSIQVRWILENDGLVTPGRRIEDMVFSIRKIDLKTGREGSASLTLLDLQLQIVPKNQSDPTSRTPNSALLPEVVFKAAHFSTRKDRRFAFQAAGKALDLRLAADGILPLSVLQKSLAKATADVRSIQISEIVAADTSASPPAEPTKSLLGNKRLSSLLVDADFAGAVLTITPRSEEKQSTVFGMLKGAKRSRAGRYGQAVKSSTADQAVLRAPGIALKVEYRDTGATDPTLSTEFKVAGSNNILAPTVVPLMLEIYSSVKQIIGEDDSADEKVDIMAPTQNYLADAAGPDTDPTAILGRVRLDASLWIQRQEFGLTCQPIAKVQATAKFDDIFITLNTVQDDNQDRFFSFITKFNNLEASVQHVFSRESTASFEVKSIVISLMNSKHVSAKNGISAILNVSPMKTNINAKQLQDFLLFREIWYPAELRHASKAPEPGPTTTESQMYAIQKYEELTATAALPWHAIVSVQELQVQVDFGSGLGTSKFTIAKLWASSKKSSDWEQNLCVGFDKVGIESSGRMSGLIELRNFHARTSIKWPARGSQPRRAPLVQASVGFDHLRVKAAFDYQPFAVADVSSFDFLMYNVRPDTASGTDRLVGILDGGKVQVFCISTAAGQVLAIVQAFERLIQEKKEAYQDSLHELDRLLRRKSVFPSANFGSSSGELAQASAQNKRTSHLLQTDVVVTLKAVDIGAFPTSFFDSQILKIEAVDVQARFAVATVDTKIQSGLGMTLGQVRVALSAVGRTNTKALGEVEISEVIERATTSKGGTIMKVPRLVASMQTWQEEPSNLIEYIFRSTFQGKVDVGWNYSRISFIRGMWDTHSKALAQRLGKPLPPAAVKITTGDHGEGASGSGQEKITAVVNMPQTNKFEYVALEPPVIDTPQLRDMGEATPPLEWIGLHRDKLPNVTHSIVIVTLLEVAKEVEEAYTRILGTG